MNEVFTKKQKYDIIEIEDRDGVKKMIEIIKSQNEYFIIINNITEDFKIAEYLGMEFSRYEEILIKYGAYAYGEGNCIPNGHIYHILKYYYFSSRKKCKKFLDSEEMLLYLVMEKLT